MLAMPCVRQAVSGHGGVSSGVADLELREVCSVGPRAAPIPRGRPASQCFSPPPPSLRPGMLASGRESLLQPRAVCSSEGLAWDTGTPVAVKPRQSTPCAFRLCCLAYFHDWPPLPGASLDIIFLMVRHKVFIAQIYTLYMFITMCGALCIKFNIFSIPKKQNPLWGPVLLHGPQWRQACSPWFGSRNRFFGQRNCGFHSLCQAQLHPPLKTELAW